MSKIVFFGTGPVAAASLESLAKNFTIELVVTKAAPQGHREAAPVEILAEKHHFPIQYANTRTELDDLIEKTPLESPVGIIVDYGVIVSQKVIDKFPSGIINSHFSLLPEWRGADPITFAILSGQSTTGVSLMLIEPTLDTGKLLAQEKLDIASDETTPSLTAKLVDLSNQMLGKYIPLYLDGKITPFAQENPGNATFSHKIAKLDGNLDPATMTATECDRKIRAYLGWPKTRLNFQDREIIVTKAKPLDNYAGDDWPDVIKCADNAYLQIIEIINPKSGRQMKTADYLRGLRD